MQLVKPVAFDSRPVFARVLSWAGVVTGAGFVLGELLRFNYQNNQSLARATFWAKSPWNFISEPGVLTPIIVTWLSIVVFLVLVGSAAKVNAKETLSFILAALSVMFCLLSSDLFLLHSYLGFDDFQPDSSYWWVVGLVWLAHAGSAAGAILVFRSSKKKDSAD
jgi:hypothetical protein